MKRFFAFLGYVLMFSLVFVAASSIPLLLLYWAKGEISAGDRWLTFTVIGGMILGAFLFWRKKGGEDFKPF